MNRWEIIARKMCVLASYGYSMDYFSKYLDDPKFLTEKWLEDYYGNKPESYVLDELNAIDLLASAANTSPFKEPAIQKIP